MQVDVCRRARRPRRPAAVRVQEPPSTRLLDAAIAVIAQRGTDDLGVSAVCHLAGVGADAFSDSYAGLTDLLLSTFDELAARTLTRARSAALGHQRWEDGVRSALRALLALADLQPHLAAFVLGSGCLQSQLILARRERLQRGLALLLDEHRPALVPGAPASALGSATVVAAAAAILQARLGERPVPCLVELHGPLMAMIVLPYLGAEASRAELCAVPASAGAHRI